MGATSWCSFVAWQPDPRLALQAAREEAFAEGEYDLPDELLAPDPLERRTQAAKAMPRLWIPPEQQDEVDEVADALDAGTLDDLSPTARQAAKALHFERKAREAQLGRKRPRQRKPRSIEELLERAAESGTHSVIDIRGVSARPLLAMASPLPPAEIRRVFGTSTPTHEQVEAGWEAVAEDLPRWHCRYLAVHAAGAPREYAFLGSSGD